MNGFAIVIVENLDKQVSLLAYKTLEAFTNRIRDLSRIPGDDEAIVEGPNDLRLL